MKKKTGNKFKYVKNLNVFYLAFKMDDNFSVKFSKERI